jgi:hypothetical protein
MEEMHRARHMRRGTELLCPPSRQVTLRNLHVFSYLKFQHLKLSKPHPFKYLCRLYYLGIIDYIIDYW